MQAIKILITDDEAGLRGLLSRLIRLEGYTVLEAGSLKEAHKIAEREDIDIILCDVKLPDGNGVDFITEAKTRYPHTEIILLTAYGNVPDGVQAMKNGAFDYLVKGNDNDKVLPLINRAAEKIGLQQKVQQLQKAIHKKYSFDSITGTSKTIQAAISLARKVAPAEATVLLTGETGTGKEVFAQAIHQGSGRAANPFVALNCSAFTSSLLESELFGYKAGAFTGAVKDKKGLMEQANGGTLFLDEIGEMPHELQSRLLRVLETAEFIKIGDTKPVKVSVRLIAATNRNLQQEVAKGNFREDLFYRLAIFTIELPSLKERIEDIPLLADYYASVFAAKSNKSIKGITAGAVKLLKAHSWKGNIRELKNAMERAILLEDSDMITEYSLPLDIQHQALPENDALSLSAVEKAHIRRVLQHAKGNKTEAARLLDIGLTTLYRKIEEYGL